MMRAAEILATLARALAPPGGDAEAFSRAGVPRPGSAAIAEEHVALFGRAGRAALSPYEGEHRGVGLDAVLKGCADHGFAPDPSFRDRPDHVSVLLTVMASLCRDAEQALERGEREGARKAAARARAFFGERLEPWVPAFFESMARQEGFPLHRALAVRGARLLRHGSARGVTRTAPLPGPTSQQPACTACGGPLGYSLPAGAAFRPPWGLVCAGCRLRADLRRLKS